MPERATDQQSARISEIQSENRPVSQAVAPALHVGERLPERWDQVEQGRALVAHFVDQGRGDAVADHSLAGHADYRHRVFAAARQRRARPAYRRAVAAIQVTDDGRRVEPAPGQIQRVGSQDVQTAQPDTGLVLASLRHRIGKDVELGQDGIEAHA